MPTQAEIVAPYWKEWKELYAGGAKERLVSQCTFCSKTWGSMNTGKKVAHHGKVNDNVTPCPAEIDADYQKCCRSSFQKGREVQDKMEAEAAKNSTAAAEPQPGDQTTLYTAKAAEVQKKVDRLLAQAHHEHGNIADRFWERKGLVQALKALAKAASFDYNPPKRKKFAGTLLDDQVKEVEDLVATLEASLADGLKTLTMDGWDNLMKLHWMALCVITQRGGFFRSAKDACCRLVFSMTPTMST